MSHKQAKKLRRTIRGFITAGMNPADPRIAQWTGSTPRSVRRAVAVVTRGMRA